MAWVKTPGDRRGMENIYAAHSSNMGSVGAHVNLYRKVMFGPSRLSRAEREALGVCVSAINDCHY